MPELGTIFSKIANVFARRGPSTLASPGIVVPVGRKADTDFWEEYAKKGLTSLIPRQFLEYHKYELSNLANLNSTDILRLMVYIEPNVSHAISNYLRVFDSGYYLTAYKPNGTTHKEGEAFLNEVVMRLNNPQGNYFISDTSLTKLVLELATHTLLDGALSGEVEFDENYIAAGLHSIDPASINFNSRNGRVIPFQTTGIGEVPLDYPTIFYIPVDSIAGDPYGTNQILSVIQPVMNKFRLLQDFARALHNLGFDRIDIEIDQQAVIDSCKARGLTDPNMILAEIRRVVEEAKTAMQSLDADDNPVHLNLLTLKALEGKNASKGLDVQAVVNVLLSEIASGLKTYSTILGKRFGGDTEGYTSVEALLFIKLVEGFQAICKRLLDRMFTLILRVEGGIQAYASWEWLEPSLRPTYESAQYYSAYSLMLWEEEQLGAISQQERNSMVRKMLRRKGPPPSDAKRVDGFAPSSKSQPQRDVSQEDEKENKRGDTNRDRKTGEQQTIAIEQMVSAVKEIQPKVEKLDAIQGEIGIARHIAGESAARLDRFADRTQWGMNHLAEKTSKLAADFDKRISILEKTQEQSSNAILGVLSALPKETPQPPPAINIALPKIETNVTVEPGKPMKKVVSFRRDEHGMLGEAVLEEVEENSGA